MNCKNTRLNIGSPAGLQGKKEHQLVRAALPRAQHQAQMFNADDCLLH